MRRSLQSSGATETAIRIHVNFATVTRRHWRIDSLACCQQHAARPWLAYAHCLWAARVRQDGSRGAAGVDRVARVMLGSVRLDQALAACKQRSHGGKALGIRPGGRGGRGTALRPAGGRTKRPVLLSGHATSLGRPWAVSTLQGWASATSTVLAPALWPLATAHLLLASVLLAISRKACRIVWFW